MFVALDEQHGFDDTKNAFLREEGVSRRLTEGAHVSERRLLVVSRSPSVAFADSSLPEGALGLLPPQKINNMFFNSVLRNYIKLQI